MAKVHVVYDGRNEDLNFDTLFPPARFANIGIPEGTVPSTASLTSDQVKTALAQHYDVGLGEFGDHFVEMNPNGNITVRPKTTFGIRGTVAKVIGKVSTTSGQKSRELKRKWHKTPRPIREGLRKELLKTLE